MSPTAKQVQSTTTVKATLTTVVTENQTGFCWGKCYKINIKFDPLPCLVKCTVSSGHLPEVRIQTGGREEWDSCCSLGGKERESLTKLQAKCCPLTCVLSMKAKSFVTNCVTVWGALEWDVPGATRCTWSCSVCVCVCAPGNGWWSVSFFFKGFLFVGKWCVLELGMCMGMQDCLSVSMQRAEIDTFLWAPSSHCGSRKAVIYGGGTL